MPWTFIILPEPFYIMEPIPMNVEFLTHFVMWHQILCYLDVNYTGYYTEIAHFIGLSPLSKRLLHLRVGNNFFACAILAVTASKSSTHTMSFFKTWISSMSIWSQARELISNSLQQKLSVITHRIRNKKSDLEMECPKFFGHLPQPSGPQDTFAFLFTFWSADSPNFSRDTLKVIEFWE